MNSYLIKNVNLLDGTLNMKLQECVDILVEDGVITSIGKDLNYNGKIIDQSGKYVLPGLINMHVHLPGSGKVGGKKVANLQGLVKVIKTNSLTKEIGLFICASGAKKQVLSGVTTLRAVGGVGDLDTTLAKRIKNKKAVGPRILASNEAICTPHGHMEGTVSKAVNSIEEAVKLVEQTKQSGADLIKLMITGGVLDCKVKGHPGDLKMPKEMVKACCDKAHELGLKVAAHVEGPEGIEIACECGVDTIEHGSYVSEKGIENMKKNNSSLILTLSPAIPLSVLDGETTGYGEDCTFNSNVLLEGMISMTEKCLENNIPVGLGTDTGCPFVTHYDMYRELVYFTKYIKGVDNNFAIHTATSINSKILGIDNITGTLEVGKCADMMFVENNPLDNLLALKEPCMVIANGEVYTKKNKKMDNIETILDTLL